MSEALLAPLHAPRMVLELATAPRRPEGATVAQIALAMSWAPHAVRGFFVGLKKRQGITVTAAERIRQTSQDGAKGSYTIYRIAGEARP